MDISIVITSYNEEAFIVGTIETVLDALREFKYTFEVIVIDDGSKDQSVVKIREFMKNHSDTPIELIINDKNRGFANNFIDGAFLAKGKYYRLCCGDNSEPKETVVGILKEIGKAELLIPVQNQSNVQGRTLFRKILSRSLTLIVNVLSGTRIRYYNGLPVFLRAHVLRYPPITNGFGFQVDIVTRLLAEGVTYRQVEVLSTVERKGNKSVAISWRNLLSVAHACFEVASRRLRQILYRKTAPRSIEIR